MRVITCHDGKLIDVGSAAPSADGGSRGTWTGLGAIDELLPSGGLARGAVHEVLWADRRGDPRPATFAAVLAGAAARGGGKEWDDAGGMPAFAKLLKGRQECLPHWSDAGAPRPVVWADGRGEAYPPGVAAVLGVPPERLFLLLSHDEALRAWAVAECLACPGVGAVVADAGRLTRVAARRLRLAAERGGGVGVLVRPASLATGPGAEHAATTRWRVAPAPGGRTVQRWRVELVHGPGGQVGRAVYLERWRERPEDDDGGGGRNRWRAYDRLRAVDPVGDRPAATTLEGWGA